MKLSIIAVAVLCLLGVAQAVDIDTTRTLLGRTRAANTLSASMEMEASGPTCKRTVELEGETGTFNDGSDADSLYSDNMDRCWTTPKGSTVIVSFNRVNMEDGYDYVRVFSKEGEQLSGSNVAAGQQYEGEDMTIWIHTDYSVQKNGFEAAWTTPGKEVETESEDVDGTSTFTVEYANEDTHAACKTAKYEQDGTLILRRGCRALLKVTGDDVATIKLNYFGASTTITIDVGEIKEDKWSATMKGSSELEVHVPLTAGISGYEVEFISKKGTSVKGGAPWHVLFNPYDPNSPVHMSSSKDLQEYVENERGQLWVGSSNDYSARPWAIDQYMALNRQVTLDLLSNMPAGDRSDTLAVVRALSRYNNEQDDNGVCSGRWSKPYDDGVEPWVWTGSSAILQKFHETGKPVKYCQCWVYAGVLNTMGRSIGLPTRAITNFDSAHEAKPFDQKVTEYYIKDGENYERDSDKSSDSIWNFHVWNEAWVLRTDYDNSNGDRWQQFDGTPQETSDRKYQMGPAPIKEMKAGDCKANWDADFGCGETNADVERWVKQKGEPDSKYKILHTDRHHIGSISATLTPDGGRNVAGHYKTEPKERYEWPSFMEQESSDDKIEIESWTPRRSIRVGEDFNVRMRVTGTTSRSKRTVTAIIRAEAISYTGESLGPVAELIETVEITSRTKSVRLNIERKDYQKYLADTSAMRFTFIGNEVDGPKTFFNSSVFALRTPKVTMLGKKNIQVGHTLSVTCLFTNPLDIPLTGVEFNAHVSGNGVDKSLVIRRDSIGPREKVHFPVKVKSQPGTHIVVATVNTNELIDSYGFTEITATGEVDKKQRGGFPKKHDTSKTNTDSTEEQSSEKDAQVKDERAKDAEDSSVGSKEVSLTDRIMNAAKTLGKHVSSWLNTDKESSAQSKKNHTK
jgi:transglutaminase 1